MLAKDKGVNRLLNAGWIACALLLGYGWWLRQ